MALNQPLDEVTNRIRSVFEQVIAEGLRRGSVEGASDEEIDHFAAVQQVHHVPAAVREVLRLVGAQPGMWFSSTPLGVRYITAEMKRHAVAILSEVEHGIRDPEGILVLTSHQGYTYHLIDGADLGLNDPPVWEVSEPDQVIKGWASVSNWFDLMRPDVAHYRTHLELSQEFGLGVPTWATDIELR